MRRNSRHILVVALALIAVNLSLISACATDAPTRSYQTISAVNNAVQTGIRAWGVVYQSRKAEDPVLWGQRYDKIEKLYAKYQAVAGLAIEVASKYGETKSLLATVKESADELLNVLAEFGVK